MLNCIVLTLFILLFPVIPQRIDLAVVPLALSLLIRSASNLILTYKKTEMKGLLTSILTVTYHYRATGSAATCYSKTGGRPDH